jgi:hypothetical protein
MMIPGQHEGRPRTAVALATPPLVPIAVSNRGAVIVPLDSQRRELPGWLKVAIFAAILLAATWLMMWTEAATR